MKVSLLFLLTCVLELAACSSKEVPVPPPSRPVQNIGPLRDSLQHIVVAHPTSTIGISVLEIETNDTVTIGDAHHYPMQSTYKFPLALTVLDDVDHGVLRLDQKIHVTHKDLDPETWSPLYDEHPKGDLDITVGELLKYSVSASDNNATDILFRLVKGTDAVDRYIHSLGVNDIAIRATEAEMHAKWDVQYTNWVRPSAYTTLLANFYRGKYLSKQSTAFLMELMTVSTNSPKRLKGLLPDSIVVAHKTGTSGQGPTGISGAINDIGIITLLNGRHVAIAVLVSDTREKPEVAEHSIAEIAKVSVEYFTRKGVTQ